MRQHGDRERRNRTKQDKMGMQRSGTGRRFAIQAVIFLVILAGLAVFLLTSASKSKEQIPQANETTETIKTTEAIIESETDNVTLKEVNVDGISLTGLNKKEAKETLLDYYPWNLKLKYKEQSIALSNPLPGIIDQLLEEINLQKEGGEYNLDLAEVRESIKLQVKDVASKWNQKPVNAQLTRRDAENNKWIYSEGESGILIDEEKTTEKIMSLIQQKNLKAEVDAQVLKQAPDLTAAQAKEKYQVIGTFETVATNNENRNNNINLAINALDGLVIFPGEAFSFNETTGNRTIERGYKPAGAYRNGEFVEEPGGGVCQVSSTLYNAMILAGIATTERHPHSFEPSYVIPGEDAMVSYDGYSGPDLRFVNNTKTSIAIRAVFKNKKMTISIIAIPILEKGMTISMRSEKVKEYDPPQPKYEEDQTLQLNQEVVVTPGVKGSTWKTYLITSKDGVILKEVYFHSSNYKGKPGLVKRNTTGVVIPKETKKAIAETTKAQTIQESESIIEKPPIVDQEVESVKGPEETEATKTPEGREQPLGPGV